MENKDTLLDTSKQYLCKNFMIKDGEALCKEGGFCEDTGTIVTLRPICQHFKPLIPCTAKDLLKTFPEVNNET